MRTYVEVVECKPHGKVIHRIDMTGKTPSEMDRIETGVDRKLADEYFSRRKRSTKALPLNPGAK